MTKTYSVCSTIHTEGYNKYAKENFESFDKFWPKQIHLNLFMEGEYNPVLSNRFNYYDFFKEEPELKKFLKRNKNRSWVPTEKLKAYKRNWRKFSFKSFAMYRASKIVDTEYLIWLDADITTTQPLEKSLLDFYTDENKFCSYLNRNNHKKNKLGMRYLLSSETGFIIFNLKHPYAEEFFERFIDYYKTDKIFNLYEVTDNFILDTVIKQMETEGKISNIELTDGTYEQPLKQTKLGLILSHQMGAKKWK